tara:strand:+ start:740 stop:982 length:243 start_codon:yes stop_codon:yes gene_type:complete
MKDSNWLICPNWIEVRCFTKKITNNDNLSESMFIDTGIVMGVHGDKPPMMKNRIEVKIEEARQIWQKLITEGWQITNPKW